MNSSPAFVAESGGPEEVIVLAAEGEIASSGVGILGGATTSGSVAG
jgi:hypothetical protein